MTKLTDEQIEFLGYHGIPLDRVFDASGMRTKDYKDVMRQRESWVAYGVTPCKEAGHTLRSRAGHCIQCDPAKITYIKKQAQGGLIYVAWSESKGLVKVGVTNSTQKRVGLLKSEMYGGASDWKLVRAWESDRVGKVETEAHRQLQPYASNASYLKNGVLTECAELFKCSSQHAVETISQILEPKAKSPLARIVNWQNTTRTKKLPTMVALHQVHEALKMADKLESQSDIGRARVLRNLAESILSAVTHGMRSQIVSVPQSCIDSYLELSELLELIGDDS